MRNKDSHLVRMFINSAKANIFKRYMIKNFGRLVGAIYAGEDNDVIEFYEYKGRDYAFVLKIDKDTE